jgi:hypothetical protein
MPPPNNNLAPTTDYGTAIGEVAGIYDPLQQQAERGVTDARDAAWLEQSQLLQNKNTALSQLDQAKANAFSNNALTANARGLAFSGYTPSQNNAYTTNTYNPNVAKVNTGYQRGLQASQANFTSTRQSLLDKINNINQERANAANSIVMDTQQAQAQAAKEAAAEAKAAAKAAQPSQAQIGAMINSGLAKVTGKDGYVAPEDYAQAYIDWVNSGGSGDSFNSNFGRYKNPNNGYYNYAITQAVKRS